MSQVEFEETRISSPVRYDNTPKMVKWIIKYSGGLIKNEKQANYFLITFIIIALILTLFFIIKSFSGVKNPPKGLEGDPIEVLDIPNNY